MCSLFHQDNDSFPPWLLHTFAEFPQWQFLLHSSPPRRSFPLFGNFDRSPVNENNTSPLFSIQVAFFSSLGYPSLNESGNAFHPPLFMSVRPLFSPPLILCIFPLFSKTFTFSFYISISVSRDSFPPFGARCVEFFLFQGTAFSLIAFLIFCGYVLCCTPLFSAYIGVYFHSPREKNPPQLSGYYLLFVPALKFLS